MPIHPEKIQTFPVPFRRGKGGGFIQGHDLVKSAGSRFAAVPDHSRFGGQAAHGAVCAMHSGIFKAHGTQAAIDHLQYSRYSQYSWFLCPHPVHCAMCFASLPEARERSESRLHDCGATRLFHFALHAKMKKRDICFENEEVQKGNAKTCLHSGKIECLHSNTGGFKAHILQGPEAREPDRATADCMPAGATRLQMCRTKNSKSVYIQHTVF